MTCLEAEAQKEINISIAKCKDQQNQPWLAQEQLISKIGVVPPLEAKRTWDNSWRNAICVLHSG